MSFAVGRLDELRKSAVAFRAEGPAFIGAIVDRATQHVANDHALADAAVVNALAHRYDPAAAIGALNPGKIQRGSQPAGVRIVDPFAAVRAAAAGRIADRLRVPPDAGVDVSIVDSRGRNSDEDFAGERHRCRDVAAVAQHVEPAVADKLNGGHLRWNRIRRAPAHVAGARPC